MRQSFAIAALTCCCFVAPFLGTTRAGQPTPGVDRVGQDRISETREQAPVRTFSGTVMRNGDEFVLSDAKTHKFYQLDDQSTASRFVDENVRITGTLDVVKNIIRIQSIAEATA